MGSRPPGAGPFSPNGANSPVISSDTYPVVAVRYTIGEGGNTVSLYIVSGSTSLSYVYDDTTTGSTTNSRSGTLSTNGPTFDYNVGDQFTLTFTSLIGSV